MPDDASGTPRWVKVFGLLALIVFVAVVVIAVTGVGGHGPGRHLGAKGGGHTGPPEGVMHGAG